jgi:K+-sensing histidine kinase KdpD
MRRVFRSERTDQKGIGVSTPHWGRPRPVAGLVLGVTLALAITAVLLPFRDSVSRASPALLLVVPVVVAGTLGGRLAAVLTALIGAIAFDVVFIPPVGSLPVALSGDVVALIVFLIVASLVGTLAANEAGRRRSAEQRSLELQTMHETRAEVAAARQRLAEEQGRIEVLERVDEQRAALLRGVSHDLRTPLAAIRAAATGLRSDTDYSPAERDRLLGVVGDQAQRLDRLVANLLSLSRIEAGGLRLVHRSVDIPELLEQTLDPLRRLFAPTVLRLETEGVVAPVPADYVQVGQVVTNLVENAVRHAPSGSTVRISATTAPDGWVRVGVTDQGRGIDPAERELIFEPFRTGSASSSTGVGLAICRGIIAAHGGRIEAGAAPDGGACVSFTLPPTPTGPTPTGPTPTGVTPTGSTPTRATPTGSTPTRATSTGSTPTRATSTGSAPIGAATSPPVPRAAVPAQAQTPRPAVPVTGDVG